MRLIDADSIPWDIDGVGTIPVVTKEEIDRMPTVDAVPVKWIEAKRDELANKLAEVAGVLDLEELADAYCHHLKSINNLLDEWEEKNE